MGDISIRVDGLGKQYRLGGRQASKTFREALIDAFAAPFKWARGERKKTETFWALDDVSFEVRRGEAVGIIGRNGAGKSTLLKILSRITKPTRGRVELFGRVGSLLEVGTGFHAELSGRDNIYLSGAILGMSRAEINRKFDEIVDFSGVEKFLDTAVKHYSSGMYVRLAFAVAAHLEPEILLVDEVLAVGDAEFQKKCLGKMEDVAHEGRTVLFVSHNMGAITQLCRKGIWIDKGKIKDMQSATETVRSYLEAGSANTPFIDFKRDDSKPAQYLSAAVRQLDGTLASEISCDDAFDLEFVFRVVRPTPGLYLSFYLRNLQGVKAVFSDIGDYAPDIGEQLTPGVHAFKVRIPSRLLSPNTYFLTVGSAAYGELLDYRADVCSFTLQDQKTRRGNSRQAVVGQLLEWKHSSLEETHS